MHKIKYTTPKEKEPIYRFQGYASTPGEIALRRDLPAARKGFVLAHEIGHKRHPIRYPSRLSVDESRRLSNEEYLQHYANVDVLGLLDELCADYWVLKTSSSTFTKHEARAHIRWIKSSFTHQMTPEMIERIDQVARTKVNYGGPKIR